MKHPLPDIFEQEIERTGQYRTLEDELAYDFESSVFRGTNRAVVRISFTLHPREPGYGGSVLFVQPDDPSLRSVAAPLAQGIWQALADFRLKDFALVVQSVEAALSGQADALLTELGARAIRHALHGARLRTHDVEGWQKPPKVQDEDSEEEPRLSGAERRARREERRRRAREDAESGRRPTTNREGRSERYGRGQGTSGGRDRTSRSGQPSRESGRSGPRSERGDQDRDRGKAPGRRGGPPRGRGERPHSVRRDENKSDE